MVRWARCNFFSFSFVLFFHVCTFTPFFDVRPFCFPFLPASFCPCYVSRFSFISLCFSFSLFRWPRPWPYFALLYLTLPSRTFLNPNSKKRSTNTDFQQRTDPRSCCPPNRLIMSKSIQVFSCRHRLQVVIPKVPCVWDVCVCGQSAHLDRPSFFGTWRFENTTPMSIAVVTLLFRVIPQSMFASVSFVFLRGVSLRCHVFVFSCFNAAFVALTHVSWWCWTCATLNIFFRRDVTCDQAARVCVFFFNPKA